MTGWPVTCQPGLKSAPLTPSIPRLAGTTAWLPGGFQLRWDCSVSSSGGLKCYHFTAKPPPPHVTKVPVQW